MQVGACSSSRIKKNNAAIKWMISMLVVLFICTTYWICQLLCQSTRYIVSFGHRDTLNLFILSIIGTVGIKLKPPFSSQVSFWPRLDRFQTLCLLNNLPGEKSDQPRQKTRLTVPDCAVKEIRSLTEWSYSVSCLTDGGRRLHRETKTEEVKRAWGCFLSSRCLFDCEVKGGSGGLFGWLTLKPHRTDLSLTSRRPEVNTQNDLLSPVQLKTKRDRGRGRWTDVSRVWLRWLLRSIAVAGGGAFQVSQRLQFAWWMVKHNEWTLPGRSSLTFSD